ncbi:MAG: hypothetical protein J6V44_13035 [Methanobrevibacter sp.]|nr:hypothetical protein [Methanobrevibacter sp.]MBO7696805.1 hypothetical protein [Methanobrevibacter sp.]
MKKNHAITVNDIVCNTKVIELAAFINSEGCKKLNAVVSFDGDEIVYQVSVNGKIVEETFFVEEAVKSYNNIDV